jgi:hypothetical protein
VGSELLHIYISALKVLQSRVELLYLLSRE